MALRKLERSCQTPNGWRLATVEEAKNNLEWIKDNNLLEEWDLARLLNGWIGGSAYDFNVQEAFRSCLGYMIVIDSPTPEISHADDRNAGLYSEVPRLSNEGRSAAVLLCSEDWNVEVLYWLMPGDDPPKWEDDETKAVSEIVSKVAREWQGVRAKSRVLSSLEDVRMNIQELLTAFAVDTKKSLEALTTRIQVYEKGKIANEILEEFIYEVPKDGDGFLDQIGLKEDLKMFKDLGFDTSVPSTWETLWYLTVDVVKRVTYCALCKELHSAVVMHSTSRPQHGPDEDEDMDDDWPILASLIFCAYQCCRSVFDMNVEAVAEEANGDIKRFAEILRDRFFSMFISESKSDVFSTFLVRAVMKGNVNLVKRLIDSGVQPSETYYKEGTALHHAVGLEDESVGLKIAEMLLEGNTGLVNVKAKDTGETALNKAIEEGRTVNMVSWLLHLSSEPESYFEDLDLSVYLRESSRMGYVDLVEKLLDGGASPFGQDDEGKTALHYAAEVEDYYDAMEIIERLVSDTKQGSTNWEKTSAGDKYGRNALHVAAFLGRDRLCRWLLRCNRNLIDSKDRDGQSAIYYAVAGPHDDPYLLSVFISIQPNQVLVEDFSQTTPLHVAAARGKVNMVKKLLSVISGEERKKNYVEAPDVLGQTALHKAASGGHKEIVEELLANGADPLKERDCDGKTALHFAVQAKGESAEKIAELLLKSCKSNEQRSLLLFASAGEIGLGSNSSLDDYLDQEKSKIQEFLEAENLLRVAARLGDPDMTREFITRGANIGLIRDKEWLDTLSPEEQTNVKQVVDQIKNNVEQGTDKPALRDNLGRNPFAIGLAALFLNPFMKSPITVGVSGEWGMGKSSVMVQTESILLRKAAQLAFKSSFQKNDIIIGASESKLSATGKARRSKIANAIKKLDAKRWAVLDIIDNIQTSIKQVKKFTTEVLKKILQKNKGAEEKGKKQKNQQTQKPSKAKDLRICSRLRKFWSNLRALWEESAPEDLSKFDEFFGKTYQDKYHHIYKSLAVINRHDMFEEDEESGSGNQNVGEMPHEEYSLQWTTPSILTVQYNAWHYRNETEAWAGLAVKITEEFEATMTVAHKLRTSCIYNWRNQRDSICLKVIFPFFLAVVVASFLTIIIWLVLGTAHNKDVKKLKYGGLPASMIIAAWGLGKSIISFVKPISSQVVDYICLPDHSQKLGYHQKVIDDINFLKEQLCYKPSWMWKVFAFAWCCITWRWYENYVPETKIPKMPPASDNNLRIIVFVDDLDRCEENVILQVLSAVNLVLAACQINVILSMEKSMIQRAIIRKYGNNNSKVYSKSNEDLADKYLRKIVQLPLHLPDPSDKESNEFLQCQLGVWDSRKGSSGPAAETEKHNAYRPRKTNPKFQIGTSIPEKPQLGRRETKKDFRFVGRGERKIDLAESGAKQQKALTISARGETKKDLAESGAKQQTGVSISDTDQQGSAKTEEQEIVKKPERVSPITQMYINIQKCLCNVRTDNSQSGVEAKVEIDNAPNIEQQRKRDEQGDQEQRSLSLLISAMLIPNYTPGERKAFCFLHTQCTGSRKLPREWKCLMAYHRLAWNILYLNFHLKYVDPVEGWQVQLIAWIFVCWEWGHLITTLIQKWNKLEVLRRWKVTEEKVVEEKLVIEEETIVEEKVVEKSSGPSLREIVENYIDERWPPDKKSSTKQKDEEVEKTSGDSPEKNMTKISSEEDKKGDDGIDSLSNTEEVEKTNSNLPEKNMTTISSEEDKKGDDSIDSLSNTEEVEKTNNNLPEKNMTTISSEEDLKEILKEQKEMREALSKNLKEQEEMREALRKNLKEQEEMREALRKVQEEMREALRKVQEEMRDMMKTFKKKVLNEEEDKRGESFLQQNQTRIIKKIFIEEEDIEGESSLLQYTTAEKNQKTEKEKDEEEREEWIRLRDTLRRFNVSMDGIQAFQKFRFYCQPGHLPWPLRKQA